MAGVMVVDVPFRNFGGILGTWYLVGLICLQSLIQILRNVTLTVHKVENGVIRNVTENAFKGSLLGCFDYVPYTALTIV